MLAGHNMNDNVGPWVDLEGELVGHVKESPIDGGLYVSEGALQKLKHRLTAAIELSIKHCSEAKVLAEKLAHEKARRIEAEEKNLLLEGQIKALHSEFKKTGQNTTIKARSVDLVFSTKAGWGNNITSSDADCNNTCSAELLDPSVQFPSSARNGEGPNRTLDGQDSQNDLGCALSHATGPSRTVDLCALLQELQALSEVLQDGKTCSLSDCTLSKPDVVFSDLNLLDTKLQQQSLVDQKIVKNMNKASNSGCFGQIDKEQEMLFLITLLKEKALEMRQEMDNYKGLYHQLKKSSSSLLSVPMPLTQSKQNLNSLKSTGEEKNRSQNCPAECPSRQPSFTSKDNSPIRPGICTRPRTSLGNKTNLQPPDQENIQRRNSQPLPRNPRYRLVQGFQLTANSKQGQPVEAALLINCFGTSKAKEGGKSQIPPRPLKPRCASAVSGGYSRSPFIHFKETF